MDCTLTKPLSEIDPELYDLCKREKKHQVQCLEMIASENMASRAVLETLSSSFHNKYSEGQVGARYYGGNEVVDEMESLCKKRSLAAFRLDPAQWGVNVQPYSGSPANFAIYTAILGPHGRLMGLDLPDGGHLTHGFKSATRKVSATSLFFESMPYKVDPVSGLIDYDALERSAQLFRPNLIVAGMSCYVRNLDYARFRSIADKCGAMVLADMAHISGLVAGGVVPSPFEYCDIVSSTTHKSLRGPRAGIIFFRKGVRKVTAKGDNVMYDLEKKIDEAVFPGLQGGPHNNTIAAMAVAMKLAAEPSFKQYQQQILDNCQTLCKQLTEHSYEVVTGGSDNHICHVNFRRQNIEGAKVERILECVNIITNKNTCPGDKSAFRPSGVRFGTPALTSRGLKTDDMVKVATFIHRGVQLGLSAQSKQTSKNTVDEFKALLLSDDGLVKEIASLREEVTSFAETFGMPGIDNY